MHSINSRNLLHPKEFLHSDEVDQSFLPSSGIKQDSEKRLIRIERSSTQEYNEDKQYGMTSVQAHNVGHNKR